MRFGSYIACMDKLRSTYKVVVHYMQCRIQPQSPKFQIMRVSRHQSPRGSKSLLITGTYIPFRNKQNVSNVPIDDDIMLFRDIISIFANNQLQALAYNKKEKSQNTLPTCFHISFLQGLDYGRMRSACSIPVCLSRC